MLYVIKLNFEVLSAIFFDMFDKKALIVSIYYSNKLYPYLKNKKIVALHFI